jgi:CubicO group peptidase (beta-lactamase class C family)
MTSKEDNRVNDLGSGSWTSPKISQRAPVHSKSSAPADTAAAKRLHEITSLASNASPTRVADYVKRHYAPAYAQREPLARRIASFMDWKARGGMEVIEVTSSEAFRIETVVHQPFSEERWVLDVRVEAEQPHRIEAVMVGRAPLPVISPALSDQAAAERFIEYVGRLARVDLFSGAVLIARHGAILGQKAYGLANRDFNVPNNLDTRFNVASLCKSWTGVAIGQLVEAGKLSFKDALAKYLEYPTAEAAAEIRIEHLLSHTAGLGSYFTEEFYRTARHHIRTVDDYLALSKDQMPTFKPGTAWKYSNTGMVVLGKVIEIVTGRTYFDYVQSNILDRAGMSRSGFLMLDQVNENVAVGYGKQWSIDGVTIVNSLFENFVGGCPAGCGFSTVGDVFRFAEALNAGTLVSKEMRDVMTTAKPELSSPDYGFGFSVHPQRALYGHSGGLLGVSANLDIVEDPGGWVVAILANDLGMRTPTLKARQLIGVTIPESAAGRSYLPAAGITAR